MMGLYTFPKEERIRRRADFLKIFREGTKSQTAHFWISFRPNGLPHRRLGITVGKRVGSAVVRNRLKRRIREFYRQNKSLFPGATDCRDYGQRGCRPPRISGKWLNELKGIFKGAIARRSWMLTKIIIALIRFYRYFLSPLTFSSCRFVPSCSAYALEAVERFGPV